MEKKFQMCTCWVRCTDIETQYTTRWGAHSLACKLYSPSGDPIDDLEDTRQRREWEARVARISAGIAGSAKAHEVRRFRQ